MRIFVLLPLLIVLGISFSAAQDAKSELRTWTSIIGTKVEAELVSLTGNQVTLKTKAGKTLKLPLNKLSKADQDFLKGKYSPKEPTKEKPVAETKPPAISNELLTAVKKGDEAAVKRQLADGADIAGREKNGATVLHHAAVKGHHEIIKILLKAGADVNAKMRNNNTPLHMAIFVGAKKDTLLALLEGGANVNAQSSLKWTPLDTVELSSAGSASWMDETIALLRKRGGKTKEELYNESISSLAKPEGVNVKELDIRGSTQHDLRAYIKFNSGTLYTGKAYGLHENGQKELEANFKDGKLEGIETNWYKDGKKRSERNFKDGKEHGIETHWYKNGRKMVEVKHKDGKAADGLLVEWHENGQKQREVNYKDGKEISEKWWNSKGEEVATHEEAEE
jgi:antitoxin component YwqK of YwqJK toxin-antitoxin module